MRKLHLFLTSACLLVSSAAVFAEVKFELQTQHPAPRLMIAPAPAALKPPRNPNVIDLQDSVQKSRFQAQGIVGRIDERGGIGFDQSFVREVVARDDSRWVEYQRFLMVAALGAFLISGCWFLWPRSKKRRRKSRRPALVPQRTRSRFSY